MTASSCVFDGIGCCADPPRRPALYHNDDAVYLSELPLPGHPSTLIHELRRKPKQYDFIPKQRIRGAFT